MNARPACPLTGRRTTQGPTSAASGPFLVSAPRTRHAAPWALRRGTPVPRATGHGNAPQASAGRSATADRCPHRADAAPVGYAPPWARSTGSRADTAKGAAMTAQCRTEGCAGPVHVLSLCAACYRRERAKRLGPCRIAGCVRLQHSRGMCSAHYFREWRSKRASK
jgi:hypothetical protein